MTTHELLTNELERATQEGVTISQAPEPRDTFLAGYLSALQVAIHLDEQETLRP